MVVDAEKEALCPITLDSTGEKTSDAETKHEEARPELESVEKGTEPEKASQDDGELVEIQHSES